MTTILSRLFLRTLDNQSERNGKSTAKPDRFTVSDILHAGECDDWVNRSLGLGAASLDHRHFNRIPGDYDHA